MTVKVVRSEPINLRQPDLSLFHHELERDFNEAGFHTVNYAFYYGAINHTDKIDKLSFLALFKALRKKKRYYKEAIWIVDRWSNNYFHWLTEVSQKLSLIKKNGLDHIPLLIPYQLYDIPFVRDFLSLFDQYDFKVIRGYEAVLIKNTIIPRLNIPTGNYHEELLRHFFKNRNLQKQPYRKVFIDRPGVLQRNIINGEEFKSIVEEYEFEIIYPETLTLKEQIKIFSETKLLVGVHGAGLTNMLFMNPGTKVLEFRKNGDSLNNCYFSLASAMNVKYYYQLCETDQPEKLTQYNNFYVDIASLKKNIELILSDD